MDHKNGLISRIFPILIILAGICLLGYPYLSEYLFEHRTDSIIKTEAVKAESNNDADNDALIKHAIQYNKELSESKVTITDPFTLEDTSFNDDYIDVLNIDGDGYIGTVEIPRISVELPIYHGTDVNTLERGVGHLHGSSFPIEGENVHSVLSAHTGLNKAKLFTDLVNLEPEDMFFIHILDRTYAYQVVEINVVLPEDTSLLGIKKGQNLCTLVTCTPYGINDHRLLVTGEKVDYTPDQIEDVVKKEEQKPSESMWMRSYKKAIMIGLAASFIIVLIMHLIAKRKDAAIIEKNSNDSDQLILPKGIYTRAQRERTSDVENNL